MFNSEKEMKMFAPVRNNNSKVFLNLLYDPSKEEKKVTRIAEKESKRVLDMRKPSKGTVVTYIAWLLQICNGGEKSWTLFTHFRSKVSEEH